MPQRSFSMNGTRPTGKRRLRRHWWYGVVLELQHEHTDGRVTWDRAPLWYKVEF